MPQPSRTLCAPLDAYCHLGLGKLHGRIGDRAKGDEHLGTAITMYRDMDMGFWLAQAETEWASWDSSTDK